MAGSTAVLVLAGGRSRRMGTDKARLPWRGQSLLDWQKNRLAALGWPVYHSGPGGIEDLTPGYPGPLGGLQAALAAEPGIRTWLLVPVDMPGIGLDALRRLVRETGRTGTCMAYRDYPLPMAVPANDALASRLNAWLADPDGPRSLIRLHQALSGGWLEPTVAPDEWINLNTPDDWQRFARTGSPAGETHE